MRAACLGFVAIAACHGGAAAPPPDASPDAIGAAVVAVSCSSVEPVVLIGTAGGEYAPNPATIAVGDVVEWMLSPGHTAHSLPSGLFALDQGEHACLRFRIAGDYEFYCQVHGFRGLLHVE